MGKRKAGPEGHIYIVHSDGELLEWGKRIEARMRALGMSQQDLADQLAVTHVTVWRWINGKAEPRRSHKKALADELGTTVSQLFAPVA